MANTITIDNETETVILGVINSQEFDAKTAEIGYANRIERSPNSKGNYAKHPATYFVRPIKN